jgi:hypothetical protein
VLGPSVDLADPGTPDAQLSAGLADRHAALPVETEVADDDLPLADREKHHLPTDGVRPLTG